MKYTNAIFLRNQNNVEISRKWNIVVFEYQSFRCIQKSCITILLILQQQQQQQQIRFDDTYKKLRFEYCMRYIYHLWWLFCSLRYTTVLIWLKPLKDKMLYKIMRYIIHLAILYLPYVLAQNLYLTKTITMHLIVF